MRMGEIIEDSGWREKELPKKHKRKDNRSDIAHKGYLTFLFLPLPAKVLNDNNI